MKIVSSLIVAASLASAAILAPAASAQIQVFNTPTAIPSGGLSNLTAFTISNPIPIQQANVALSGTNTNNTVIVNLLFSVDGIHVVTNGQATLTFGAVSNQTLVIPKFNTNAVLWIGYQLIPNTGATNPAWASVTYNPFGY